jgi:hypothetical protein
LLFLVFMNFIVHLVVDLALIPHIRRNTIYDIRNVKRTANSFNIVDGVLAKKTLKDAGHQINHHYTPLFSQNVCKLPKYLHPLLVDYKRGRLADGCTLSLNVDTKVGRQLEYGVIDDMLRDIFMPFLLVADVDQPMIYTHLQFCR